LSLNHVHLKLLIQIVKAYKQTTFDWANI